MKTNCTIIESPYRHGLKMNRRYAKLAMLDSILRGESPFASHLLYPHILNDDEPKQRKIGIHANFDWITKADKMAVYYDLGYSDGMKQGMAVASEIGLYMIDRKLDSIWMEALEYSDAGFVGFVADAARKDC